MKKKPKSSGARMREAGYKPIQLWLTKEQHADLFAAAELDGRKATQFLIFHGIAKARKLLGKDR